LKFSQPLETRHNFAQTTVIEYELTILFFFCFQVSDHTRRNTSCRWKYACIVSRLT